MRKPKFSSRSLQLNTGSALIFYAQIRSTAPSAGKYLQVIQGALNRSASDTPSVLGLQSEGHKGRLGRSGLNQLGLVQHTSPPEHAGKRRGDCHETFWVPEPEKTRPQKTKLAR